MDETGETALRVSHATARSWLTGRRRPAAAATALLVAGLLALAGTAAPAAAQGACTFTLGFATLRGMVGPAVVGNCLENERHNPANGDAEQRTSNGLLVWRKADNWTAFTDGYRTWVNGPHGLQERLNSQHFAWEGTDGGAGPQLVTPDPVQLVQDYYLLINRQDYADAYALWNAPPAPYDQFVAGYADTAQVQAAFGPLESNAAAGHLGVDLPTVLVAQQATGGVQAFAGCYTVTRPDPGMLPPGSPPQPWLIQLGGFQSLPGVTGLSDPGAQTALATPCPGHTAAGERRRHG